MSTDRLHSRVRYRSQRFPRQLMLAIMILVAMLVILYYFRAWLDDLSAAGSGTTAASVVAEAGTETETVEPAVEPAPVVESVVALSPPPASAEVPVLVVTPTDPIPVIMLPARVESSDPAAAAATEAVRQSTLRALRAMRNINVVEVSAAELAGIVPPNAGPLGADNLVYLAVTRRHEGRVVAEISGQPVLDGPSWLLNLSVGRPGGGGGGYGGAVARDGGPRTYADAENLGIRYADRIASDADRVARDSNALTTNGRLAADARNILLDATRSEVARLQSLSQVLDAGQGLDSAAIAAAADLAMRSASTETRQRVWTLLRRNAFDPTLAQPMSYALLSDGDATVRKEAALGLAAYLGDAAASAALEHAARNDSSAEVRLAARMATMDFTEQQAFRRETLLDRSLTPAERFAPTIVDDTSRMGLLERSSGAAAMEEALAYAEIAPAVETPALKIQALSLLQMSMLRATAPFAPRSGAEEAKIVDTLVEISRHADERVRRQALTALTTVTQISGNAEGRAALESVLENEPELAAELRLAEALQPQQPALFSPRPPPSNTGRGQ